MAVTPQLKVEFNAEPSAQVVRHRVSPADVMVFKKN